MKLPATIWFWLRSRTARQALAHHRHVKSLFHFQRDLIPDEAAQEIGASLADVRASLASGQRDRLTCATDKLLALSSSWLIDTWRHRTRGIFETLFVALAVILGFRTFFLQTASIPTGSMQPTLWGVTVENLAVDDAPPIPALGSRVAQAVIGGRTYCHVVAETNGSITEVEAPRPIFPFLGDIPALRKQRFLLGSKWHTLWFPPAELPAIDKVPPSQWIFLYAGIRPGRVFRQGEDVIKLAITAGDRIVVDRFSQNFRRLTRGEIVVFSSSAIPENTERTSYLKRLVAVGGDEVRIGDDRHLVVNGERYDSHTPGFEEVYAFAGPIRLNSYIGHLNDRIARQLRIPRGSLSPLFPDGDHEFRVRPGHLMFLGDNSLGSVDSRKWGDISQRAVLGRHWFTYWPILAIR